MTLPKKARAPKSAAVPAPARRLSPEQREQQIVAKAIEHFTRHGFAGSTRELARQIGVTQPLLYRYFPSKQALIERVYAEVFEWGPAWESELVDRSVSLRERMVRFYTEYSRVQLRKQWIRILVFAGLTHDGIYNQYLSKMRTRVFLPLLAEIRYAYGISEPRNAAELEAEIELVWGLHASIFYLGVRKWIFGQKVPKDLDRVIQQKIDAFLGGTPVVMNAMRREPPIAAA